MIEICAFCNSFNELILLSTRFEIRHVGMQSASSVLPVLGGVSILYGIHWPRLVDEGRELAKSMFSFVLLLLVRWIIVAAG